VVTGLLPLQLVDFTLLCLGTLPFLGAVDTAPEELLLLVPFLSLAIVVSSSGAVLTAPGELFLLLSFLSLEIVVSSSGAVLTVPEELHFFSLFVWQEQEQLPFPEQYQLYLKHFIIVFFL
jgi:hypothetical protein